MRIEKKGNGPWPVVDVNGVSITLTVGEARRSYDCAAMQADTPVTVDIVRNAEGIVIEGAEKGTEYLATLVIPPARYQDVPLPLPAVEVDLPDDIDPACLTPLPTTESVRAPFTVEDMAAVQLILWSIGG